ncbi:hypothetical protein GQ457_07G003340 [Hibiscus cannabinus]
MRAVAARGSHDGCLRPKKMRMNRILNLGKGKRMSHFALWSFHAIILNIYLFNNKQPAKISRAILQTMPGKVGELIADINGSEKEDKLCDCKSELRLALGIAEKHGISIPKLIDGVIDQHVYVRGSLQKPQLKVKSEMITLSPDMPPMNTKNFVWACIGNIDAQRNIFKLMIRNNESIKLSDWLLCNSSRQHCISPLLTLGTTNLKTRWFKFK